MTHTNPDKALCALRYWLQGKEYFSTLEAMELAATYHTGMRKDGVTPEFHHQVSIAMFLRTLEKNLAFPQETLTAAILHDVVEDYGVSVQEIERQFGKQVSVAVDALSKEVGGFKKYSADYYNGISMNAIASIVKGADRINNVQTMVGVFSAAKRDEYIIESRSRVLPMLKIARRKFPSQEPAYENIKHMLVSQLTLIEAMVIND